MRAGISVVVWDPCVGASDRYQHQAARKTSEEVLSEIVTAADKSVRYRHYPNQVEEE